MLTRLLLVITLLAAPALAQKPAPNPPAAAPPSSAPLALLARLPGNLAGFQRGNITDFAVMANDPRLGASVGYRSAQGVVGTVYLYDGGQADIGGRNTPALIEAQMRSAVSAATACWPNARAASPGCAAPCSISGMMTAR